MGQLLRALQTEQIAHASNAPKGTQLKLLLKFKSNQKVIFKPKWYEKDEIIEGTVYSGKDRHTAEIFAFHLGAALNLRWTAVAVGRKLNLKEIYARSDKSLKSTIFINGNIINFLVPNNFLLYYYVLRKRDRVLRVR